MILRGGKISPAAHSRNRTRYRCKNGDDAVFAPCGSFDPQETFGEGSKHAVTGRLDFTAMEARQAAPDRGMMMIKEVAPAMIAECCGFLGRANDAGKEHRGKHAVDCDGWTRAGQKLLDGIGDVAGIVTRRRGCGRPPGTRNSGRQEYA